MSNSKRDASVVDARGEGKDLGRLSDLHPAGFTHLPSALHYHPEADPLHFSVFLAIADGARPIQDTDGERRWVALDLSRPQLHALTRIRDRDALRSRIGDLQEWGFIVELRNPNRPTDFEILPTQSAPPRPAVHNATEATALTTSATPLGVQGEPALQPAQHPHNTRTTPSGVQGEPALQSAQHPHNIRTTPSGVQGEPALQPAPPAPGVQVHQPSGVQVHTALPPLREDPDKDCRCAEPHPLFITHQQYLVLKKARKRALVDAAIEEVSFRLGHPSLAPEVEHPYSMVRAIAECYSGRCRTDHGDLHGEKALMYHRARRADVEQVLRSTGSVEPDPASLGPLQNLVEELLPKLRLASGPDETIDERRERYRMELWASEQRVKEVGSDDIAE